MLLNNIYRYWLPSSTKHLNKEARKNIQLQFSKSTSISNINFKFKNQLQFSKSTSNFDINFNFRQRCTISNMCQM